MEKKRYACITNIVKNGSSAAYEVSIFDYDYTNGSKIVDKGFITSNLSLGGRIRELCLSYDCKSRVNFEIEGNTIKPSGYSFDIFKKQQENKPGIILNVIKNENGTVLGYTVFDTMTSNAVRIPLEKALNIAEKFVSADMRAYQNAIFVDNTSEKRKYIKCHTGSFDELVLKAPKKDKAERFKARKTDEEKANSAINDAEKTESPFTKEQINVLKYIANKGQNYKKVANPKLSPEQMKTLMEIDGLGFDCRYLASPTFKVDVLKFYKAEVKNGANIAGYISDKFNPSQLMQISCGVVSGIDFKEYYNPNIDANEMEEIRTRLESKLWNGSIMYDDTVNRQLRAEIQRRKIAGGNTEFIAKAEEAINKRNENKRKKK